MLTAHRFDGGLPISRRVFSVPYEFKQVELRAGDQVRIPLNDHVGRPSLPLVTVGQRVKKHEMIAGLQGRVSSAQHAPAAAVVSEIRSAAAGGSTRARATDIVLVCLADDEPELPREALSTDRLGENSSLQSEIRRRIAAAGIIGMGGGGFPAQIKLDEGTQSTVNNLIINAVECEPLASADRHLLKEHLETIKDSALMLGALLKPERITLAVLQQGDEGEFHKALSGSGVELLPTPAQYPAGSEKQLVKILTGKELPLNQLPIHAGVVCFNVATSIAMYRAAKFDEPCVSRLVTLNTNRRWVVEAPIGMTMETLLERLGESVPADAVLRSGGMMMGRAIDMQQPITKISNEISLLAERDSALNSIRPCIRCGECAVVCPARLQPQKLFEYSKLNDLDSVQDYGLFDCIECGCCSYVCPSEIPLVQQFQRSKHEVNGLTNQALHRQQLARRYEQHLLRQDNRTPAERNVTLADIPHANDQEMDAELQRLKQRLAARAKGSSDNGAV
ncbi:MAG: electron transport complex subunit RsxC [Gammaproteobacteria bacterium]